MLETTERSVFYKIRYTPIRDALRGRMTARLDLDRQLEQAALPPSVRKLISHVVQCTSLWRLEKVDVMNELADHFADGLAAGVSTDRLIEKFGSPEQAAKLIRRAVRRNRPLSWQALRFAGWSVLPLVVFYLGFSIYFFIGKPSPRTNYLVNVNKSIEAVPAAERAWPSYRNAILGLDEIENNRRLSSVLSRSVPKDSDQWPELEALLARHRSELEMIRQGAAKPKLGWVYGPKGSFDDRELFPNMKPAADYGPAGPELSRFAIPPLRSLRTMSNLLARDAAVARRKGDAVGLRKNLIAMLGLSGQLRRESPFLLSLVSLAVFDEALDEIDLTLSQAPALLPDADLVALARELSGMRVAADLVTIEFERMGFEDMLQRSFTDDGHGSGRLTPAGLDYWTSGVRQKRRWLLLPLEPAAGLLATSRADLSSEFARVMDQASINMQLPIRDADWRTPEVATLFSPAALVNRRIVEVFTPSYERAHERAERSLGHRDGMLVAIALELYKRQHGRYPQSLDRLVPAQLSEVPVDRITGNPLRYRLVAGTPVVYSVGVDRKDDAGHPAADRAGLTYAGVAAQWRKDLLAPMPDGDWLLYPQPR